MTKDYKSFDEAYQALTDIEIIDDENNFPVARIKTDLHLIEISMLSEYDYWYVLEPLRQRLFNFYINRLAQMENITSNEELLERMRSVVNTIESCKTKEDVIKKSSAVMNLFDVDKERKYFFFCLKKLGIIKGWVSWKKYQKTVKPYVTPLIFTFLWLFNFDGVKKNLTRLFEKIGRVTKRHSPIESSYSTNWEDYKKKLTEASKRNREKLGSYPGSNGRTKSEMTSS